MKILSKSLFKGYSAKRSLKYKSILLMILLGLVPLVFFGVVAIFNMNSILKDQTIEAQTKMTEEKAELFTHIMGDVESLASNLSGIDEINNALEQNPDDSAYDRLSTQAKIGYILSGYTNLNGLISIDIFAVNGSHYHVSETLDVSDVNEALLNRLYNESVSNGERLYWSGIESSIYNGSQYEKVLMASKVLKSQSSGNQPDVTGILVISYDPEVFGNERNTGNMNNGYTMLVDAKQRIIYHPQSVYIGNKISDSISKEFGDQKGFFYKEVNGEEMLVVHDYIVDTGWQVVSFIPVASILAKTTTVNIIFMFLMAVSLLMILVFVTIITRQIVQPIKKVIDTFRGLRDGNIDHTERLILKSEDEIGELGQLFNSFIDAREDITLQKKLERQLNEQNRELQLAMEKLKNTQLQMVQQEKLAAIGQLAAGVAHEINNPLGYVSGNAEMLKLYLGRLENLLGEVKKLQSDENVKTQLNDLTYCQYLQQLWQDNRIDMVLADTPEMMNDITEGLKRIAAIVNGLRGFSRNNQLEGKNTYDLNDGIQTTLLVANNEIKYNCDVSLELGEIPTVYANGGQINQVLLNVIINAVQAIKQKFDKQKGNISIKTHHENEEVFCSICDNGCGMDEEVKNRIFEPFYTTKPVGQGTGLGLSIVYDIICNQHNGSIEVTSKPGEGTCFVFMLRVN